MITTNAIRRAQDGDSAARDHVWAYAVHFVKNDRWCKKLSNQVPTELEDLAQEFVFRLNDRIDSWRHNNFDGWLRRWWYQHVVDASRTRSLHTIPISEWEEGEKQRPQEVKRIWESKRREEEDFLTTMLDRSLLQRSVRCALDFLTEDQRDVLRMYHWEELKYEEIAERLKISLSAVKGRISRGRAKLRKLLKMVYDAYIENE